MTRPCDPPSYARSSRKAGGEGQCPGGRDGAGEMSHPPPTTGMTLPGSQ